MFGGLVSKAQAHRGQTEGGGGRGQHKRAVSSTGVPWGPGRQGQSGCFPACQPISFFRKASSWSSSLIPTNLSTTSPFFMASTVGTADTWVERTKEVKSLRSELFSTVAPSSGEQAAGSGLEVTARARGGTPPPCTGGLQGYYSKENDDGTNDDIDFYIYSLDGKQLLHGMPGMDITIDDYGYGLSAVDGELYFYFSEHVNDDIDNTGLYKIKTEDLINGGTEWTKLYKAIN